MQTAMCQAWELYVNEWINIYSVLDKVHQLNVRGLVTLPEHFLKNKKIRSDEVSTAIDTHTLVRRLQETQIKDTPWHVALKKV